MFYQASTSKLPMFLMHFTCLRLLLCSSRDGVHLFTFAQRILNLVMRKSGSKKIRYISHDEQPACRRRYAGLHLAELVHLESVARLKKKGLWQGKFEMPEDWRRKNKKGTG